jgi:hypothetical protein
LGYLTARAMVIAMAHATRASLVHASSLRIGR